MCISTVYMCVRVCEVSVGVVVSTASSSSTSMHKDPLARLVGPTVSECVVIIPQHFLCEHLSCPRSCGYSTYICT